MTIWEEVQPTSMEDVEMWNSKEANRKEEDSIEGQYVGKRENVGKNNSNIYYIESAGVKMGVWGSVVLDARFSTIGVGSLVRITFKGIVQPDTGGRPYHGYKVDVGHD